MKLKLTRKKPENGDGDAAKPPPQGIAAHGNALRQLALVALGIVLVPVLLGFAYLKLVREPGLESDQIDRVATAYAVQQATNIDRLFVRLGERLSGAAGTPSAWSAIESASAEQLTALEQSLLSFFPEAIGLRVLPVGELGTATFTSADQGLRSHIQVDMVRR
ncbi:MAG: phosphomannomutase/phosphoglucomutase, partial [Halioglobus sp.]|nr:phosphomannomutase/phosphoglucomutase [Halioglobus sp.]